MSNLDNVATLYNKESVVVRLRIATQFSLFDMLDSTYPVCFNCRISLVQNNERI